VTAVTSSGFTVESVRFNRGASASASATPSTSDVNVVVTAATTYTKTVAATSKAVVVGRCVTAVGKTDDTGTVAATSIAVSAKQNGTCTQGRANG
jgi:hypothetical protein